MNGQGTLVEERAADSSRILAEPVRATMLSSPMVEEAIEPARACQERLTEPN